jgi:hypothetical protein
MSRKIVSAEVGPMPRPMPEGMFDPMPEVGVVYDDGSTEKLFVFYPDEIMFDAAEFIGLTREQAEDLRHKKDAAYLRS